MQQKNKRSKTQTNVDIKIQKVLNMAAAQKMLPKIIYDTYLSTRKDPILKQYRKSVKNLYTKQTHFPLKYNPQQARSHRQRFRQKVFKLINNELPIEYLKTQKIKGNNVITYKEQYAIFADFNQNKFKKQYSQFFDDKLDYQHQNVLSNQKKIVNKNKTCPNEEIVQKVFKFQTQKKTSVQNIKKQQLYSLPKLITNQKLNSLSSNKINNFSPQIEKKVPHKIISKNQDEQILKRMKFIGGYHPNTNIVNIFLTKQSIIKYFRQCYLRPHRIIDFLEINTVQNFVSYKAIPQRLKFMPQDHLNFMIFLFYDSNNDGIICERDLLRVFQLIKKCPLIKKDYIKLKKSAHKVHSQTQIQYKQLYKLPQITQTAYFTWKYKKNVQQQLIENQQLKEYLQKLNQQKININFTDFQKIYKNNKPFMWYDLMWRLGGFIFQGLQYS